jgi:hypothetical protein
VAEARLAATAGPLIRRDTRVRPRFIPERIAAAAGFVDPKQRFISSLDCANPLSGGRRQDQAVMPDRAT